MKYDEIDIFGGTPTRQWQNSAKHRHSTCAAFELAEKNREKNET
jgi:hypothetical protein